MRIFFIRAVPWLMLILWLPACRVMRTPPRWDQGRYGELVGTDCAGKPRILLLSSSGGGGHASAAAAIRTYLGSAYHVEIVQLFGDVLAPLDPVRLLSSNQCSAEDLYNFFLRNGMMWCGGAYMTLGRAINPFYLDYTQSYAEEFLRARRPDAIISLIPLVNEAVYRAAQRLNIPFSVVTVDLDTSNYVAGMNQPDYARFLYALPFDEPEIRAAPEGVGISASKIRVVGFPVRPEFLQMNTSAEQVRAAWGFPLDRPVIMVLMGAAGSSTVLRYAKKLAKCKMPLHLVFCAGRSTILKQRLEALSFPSHISITVVGFTTQVAELMRAADLLITKPGPTTICEALTLQLPMLLDCTSELLFWEQLNVSFAQKHGFAEIITSLHRISWHVTTLLENPERCAAMRAAMRQYPLPDVVANIRSLVDELLYAATPLQGAHGST